MNHFFNIRFTNKPKSNVFIQNFKITVLNKIVTLNKPSQAVTQLDFRQSTSVATFESLNNNFKNYTK